MEVCDRLERATLGSALRDAFGAFATGVTIVTALNAEARAVGFTANSFTSVSLLPPLLLICISKTSSNLAAFQEANSFAVNILADGQREIARRFAAPVRDRFAGTDWRGGAHGAPILSGVAAWFDCVPHTVIDAGDHLVLIGRVEAFERAALEPLVYLQGRYLTPPQDVSNYGGIRAGSILGRDDHVLLQRVEGKWRLPMSKVCASLRAARADLEKGLVASGIVPDWNVLYSLFDDPQAPGTWAFFHGRIDVGNALPDDLKFIALDSLPFDDIDVRPVRAMLRRYTQECRSEKLGLYVDDAHQMGRVARFVGVSTEWFADYEGEDSTG